MKFLLPSSFARSLHSPGKRQAKSASLWLLAPALLSLAGCSGAPQAASEAPSGDGGGGDIPGNEATGRSLVFAALQRPEPPRLASTLGTLTAENGCIRLVTVHTSYPVVWPAGSTFNPATMTILPPGGGKALKVGEAVELNGGALTVDERINQRLTTPLPDDCLGRVWMAAF